MTMLTALGGIVMPKIDLADHDAAIRALETARAGAAPAEQAELTYRLGFAWFNKGEVYKALDTLQQALGMAVEHGDRPLEARILNGLSVAHDHVGLRHDSIREAQEAERIGRELDDPMLQALAWQNQGHYYKEVGRHPRAFTLFQQVREVGVALGDRRLEMMGILGMGRTTCMAEPDQADEYGWQAVALADELGDRAARAICMSNLADWQIYRGHYEAALAAYEAQEQLCAAIGDVCGVGRSFTRRGQVHAILKDYDRAWPFLNTGLPLVLSNGDIEAELHTYLTMGHVYAATGDIGRACDYYQRTLEKSRLAPDSACALFAQRALTQLALGQLPQPGILPAWPLDEALYQNKNKLLLEEIHYILAGTYATFDRAVGGRYV